MSNFYEENHQQYFNSTVGLDPSAFLEPLAKLLDPQATILDIGCGSGRDLLWFARRGFQPTGFEQSPNLTCLAREHADCPVIEGDFHPMVKRRHRKNIFGKQSPYPRFFPADLKTASR